jgi:hypothetical protein
VEFQEHFSLFSPFLHGDSADRLGILAH